MQVFTSHEKSPFGEAVWSILGNEAFMVRVLRYLKGMLDKTKALEIKKIEIKNNVFILCI